MLFWQNISTLKGGLRKNYEKEMPEAITHLWCETSVSNADISGEIEIHKHIYEWHFLFLFLLMPETEIKRIAIVVGYTWMT